MDVEELEQITPFGIYTDMIEDLEVLQEFVQYTLKDIIDSRSPKFKDGLLFLSHMYMACANIIRALQIIWWFCWDGSAEKSKAIESDQSTCNELLHGFEGMNYNLITENLIVGSQPQKPEDINHLKEEQNVAYILNLQQDGDIAYWGIDLESIVDRCKQLGVRHMRRPARDFDGDSLRSMLPKAVSSLEWAISEGKGRVYVHCTAGLGRAPAVAIAYMFWFCEMDLNTSYDTLTAIRPCGPNKKAIRGATYDLAKNDPGKEPFESLPENAFGNVADWERKLIQDRVHRLRGT